MILYNSLFILYVIVEILLFSLHCCKDIVLIELVAHYVFLSVLFEQCLVLILCYYFSFTNSQMFLLYFCACLPLSLPSFILAYKLFSKDYLGSLFNFNTAVLLLCIGNSHNFSSCLFLNYHRPLKLRHELQCNH